MPNLPRRRQRRNNSLICLAIILLEMVANQLFQESVWLILPINIVILGLVLTAIYRGWNQDIALAFAVFYSIQFATCWILLPTDWDAIQLLVLSCTVYWLIQRPPFKSEDIGPYMGVAVYEGEKTPLGSWVASLFTLNARSIAMVYKGTAMVPKGGTVKSVDAGALPRKGWIILNTFVRPSELAIHYFNDMKGAPVSTYGCVKASKYVLQEIGIEPSPVPGFIQRNLLNGR